MEGQGAKDLAEDEILKRTKVEIGGFIGDNDSQSKDALQSISNHTILKQADMNHTKKNVKNLLYDIKGSKSRDPLSELSHDSILHLVKCFSYAVHQNKGKLEDLTAAIFNIPRHVLNDHSACGKWCQAEKENYQSSFSVKSPVLMQEIKTLFENLSKNSQKFLTSGSSQANESIFNTKASKAPKAIFYSGSGSSDHRFSASVAQKNCYETYILQVLDQLQFQYPKTLADYFEKKRLKAIKRYEKALEPAAKKRRIEATQKRSQLKYRIESSENFTYKSSVSLFEEEKSNECVMHTEEFTLFPRNQASVVFFDIETGGLDFFRHEIIQICVKFQDKIFSSYITPMKSIDQRASQITHITKSGRKLFKNGIEVITLPRQKVMSELIKFLKNIGQKCLLVAHNDKFDAPRLVNAFQELGLDKEFEELVYGFSDSLLLLRKLFPELECHKLEFLASNKLEISCDQAHDATFDVIILEKLCGEFLNVEDFLNVSKPFEKIVLSIQAKDVKKTFYPMMGVISDGMINRLSQNGISYDLIVETFYNKGEDDLVNILRQEKEGKPTIIKSNRVLEQIVSHLRELSEVIQNDKNLNI